MKHCCHRLALAFLSALLVLPFVLRADVVTMKDGKKYLNAKVISETPDTVTFDYVVVGTIHDTRTEPKSAVDQIIKQKPEETEILALRKLMPTADLLTADKYESLIQDQVRPFVTKYAGTPQATEAEGIIKTLQEEKEKVVGGALKVEGKWLTPEAVKLEAHSIDAYRVRRDMKDLAAEGKLREALLEWQALSNVNDGYTDTLQFVKAVPEVLDILAAYKKQLDRMIFEQPQIQKRRDDSLSKMLPTDPLLARTKRAIEAELLAFKTQTDVEKKMKPPTRWFTIYKYDLKSLQAASKIVIDETARLKALDLTKLTTQNEALEAATHYLAGGDVESTEAAIQRANAVVGLTAYSNKAIQSLRNRLVTLKAETNKKLKAQKAYGSGSVNAITSGSGSTTDSRVAEALAATEKAKGDKKDAKDAEKLPSASAEGPDGAPDKKADKESTSSTRHKDKEKKKARTPHTEAAAPPPAPEEGGIQNYLLMGGGGLLAVLLTVMFLQKRKQNA